MAATNRKVNIKIMHKSWIRHMPIAQYVASFKLNLLERSESLKSIKMKFVNVRNWIKANTNRKWHNPGDRILFIAIELNTKVNKNWNEDKETKSPNFVRQRGEKVRVIVMLTICKTYTYELHKHGWQ
jgi:hypothetical protein